MLNIIPFYSALNKPSLFMGGERELMMMGLLLAFLVVYVNFSFLSLVLSVVIWLLISTALRMMAKSDPIMSKIYTRQLKYQKYYRAKASAFA